MFDPEIKQSMTNLISPSGPVYLGSLPETRCSSRWRSRSTASRERHSLNPFIRFRSLQLQREFNTDQAQLEDAGKHLWLREHFSGQKHPFARSEQGP